MADGSGRLNYVGIGRETTRGTAVAPAYWSKWLELDFQDRVNKVRNDSALGTLDMYNDSEVIERWSDGKLDGKITDKTFGLILAAALGANSTDATASGETIVYDHTYATANTAIAQSLTLVRKDSNSNKRYARAMLSKLDIEVVTGEYAKYSAEFTAMKGVTNTDVPALVAENEFVPRHAVVKMASAVAGLNAATQIPIKSFKLSIDNHVEPYFVLGSDEPAEINNLEREVTGEITLRYTDTTYETLWTNNTDQALRIDLTNTDVTLGTATNPKLRITLPKVTLEDFAKPADKSAIVEQTFKFTGMYDFTAGYAISAVLTNTVASY